MPTQRKKIHNMISMNSGKSDQNTFIKPQINCVSTFTIHYLTNSKMTKCFIFAVLFISEVFGQLKFGGSRPSTSTFTVNV